jgi:8-oxo-dGTP pyrophosphatase MutT (NUDIX family)
VSFDSLLALYGDLATVVQRSGRIYPAALEGHCDAAAGLVAFSREPLWIDPGLRAGGQHHLEAVARRSPQMHDGRVLACVATIGFPLTCVPGGYFDAIATSDSLRAEFLDSVGRTQASRADPANLPLRRLAHEASGGDPLHSGRGRVAAVGVSVAVTLPSAPLRVLVLGLRNHAVATDPDMWHVAPSGTLEPSEEDPVIALVERELSEELGVRPDTPAALAARLKPLGIGFDLLRLRPEICLRLDLEEHEFPREGPFLTRGEFQDRCLVALSGSSMSAFWERHPPELLTPAAAAAIALLEDAQSAPPA